jgi:hypothetical protein
MVNSSTNISKMNNILSLKWSKAEKTMIYVDGNPDPGLGQA